MKHVVMFSGGIGSWAAARRVAQRHGTKDLVLLFTDTKTEDEDLYRFIRQAARNVGGKLVWLADGRDVWQVFKDSRYLGNSRIDPCSRILKRELSRKWVEANCDVSDTTLYLGIDWSEDHRYVRAAKAWLPWTLKAPLCDPPYVHKNQLLAIAKAYGIKPPRLYALGFPHNNCGGFCVKAGQAHFKNLLKTLPCRYAYHEQKEQELRDYLGKDVSILREQRDNVKYPLTLRVLRERIEANTPVDEYDWGGCGCFLDQEDAA